MKLNISFGKKKTLRVRIYDTAIIKLGGVNQSFVRTRTDPMTEIKTGGLAIKEVICFSCIWNLYLVGIDGVVVTFCINLIVPVC